jgi:phosphopantetheinyl transferase (holo-ACP synthase)
MFSSTASAATPAGRRCGLGGLTAAAFTPSETPLLTGACSHPGTAGIFADREGTWKANGPQLPATLAHQDITVLRLTQTAGTTAALLAAGTGPAASILTAWSADNASHRTLSPTFRLNGATLSSTAFGPAGTAAIVLNGNRAVTITRTATAWRTLPALPAGTATLAPGPGGGYDALAVHRTKLTIWQLTAPSPAWAAT